MTEKLYTPQEIADHFHVTRRTVYTWKAKGYLTYTQVGRPWYVSESDLEAFEDRHRMESVFRSMSHNS